jgi:hypothetical protein
MTATTQFLHRLHKAPAPGAEPKLQEDATRHTCRHRQHLLGRRTDQQLVVRPVLLRRGNEILVTDATGNVGRALARALVGAGEPVRALVRRPAERSRLPAGVAFMVGDLNRPETCRRPPGRAGVRLLSGYQGLEGLPAAPRRAGVEHLAVQSTSAAPGDAMGNAVARYPIPSDLVLRWSGLAWPFAQLSVAMIDPSDVATFSARVRTSAGHAGRSDGHQPECCAHK